MRAIDVAVCDKHSTDTLAGQVFGNEFDRHAGADQERRVLGESCEKLVGECNRGRGDRYGIAADLCVSTDLFSHRKRVLKKPAQAATD